MQSLATRRLATLGSVVLLGCCALAPWAHATARCVGAEGEERAYALVEIEAVDGGSVPESVRARWADGVVVSSSVESVTIHVSGVDETVFMESEAGQ